MRDFRQLAVWEKSHLLTLNVYKASSTFSPTELYGLTSQIRRSALSIPSNIAEGCGRDTEADFARFLQIALGSASELEYQLLLSRDLHYLADDLYEELSVNVTEVKRMLAGLLGRIRADH